MDENISDSPVDWDDIDYEGISEFFEQKGAVELMAYLDGYGDRFEELDNNLNVSRGYINNLKDEAFALDLIYPTPSDRDGTIRQVWALTPLGMIFAHTMVESGMRKKYAELLSVQAEFEKKKENFLEWSDDSDNLKQYVSEVVEDKNVERGSNLADDLKLVTRRPDHSPSDSTPSG